MQAAAILAKYSTMTPTHKCPIRGTKDFGHYRIIRGLLSLRTPEPQTGCRSVQPFLQDSRSRPSVTQTEHATRIATGLSSYATRTCSPSASVYRERLAHSAGFLGWPFPMLKCKYTFQYFSVHVSAESYATRTDCPPPYGVHTVIHWLRANYTIGRRVIPFEQNAVV